MMYSYVIHTMVIVPSTTGDPSKVIHGEDAVELLRRVGQSLAKSPNRQEARAARGVSG